jgi:hypothetical protein
MGRAGRVHVFFGSATGPRATPALSLSGPDPSAAGGWLFGWSVVGAVDVNGDGYPDLVVRAARGETITMHVFLGSATGLSPTPALSFDRSGGGHVLNGSRLTKAGDVNGDGYADLAVTGTNAMGDMSVVDVYLGSATGLSPTPAFRLTGRDGERGSFGWPMVGTGDLNGDGYGDLAVGSVDGLNYSGRVYVYLGSETGPSTTASYRLTDPEDRWGYWGTSLARAAAVRRAPARTPVRPRTPALVCRAPSPA